MSKEPSLYRRLVLQAREDVPDGMGGFSSVWAPQGALWANVEIQSGHERKIGERDTSVVNYRIIVRSAAPGAPSRPKPDQRFCEFERVFNILAVGEYGSDGRFLQCWTEEGRA